ncbi:MAG: hypothetical protein A2V75_11060 [Actinobacteria bacterium RBG_16_70_17]|nr:MAG: hypothetical protein A2V75_11060 [Actinobacteria bacterium RBG_16_70_17]
MPEAISARLVDLIERNADRLTLAWVADVKRRPETPTYHGYPDDALHRRVHDVYRRLGKWISRETTVEEIARVYTALGRQRFAEGFAPSEVLEALILTRRHLWLLVLKEGFLETALDLQAALDLNARAVLFFDRSMYYSALGFEQAAAEAAARQGPAQQSAQQAPDQPPARGWFDWLQQRRSG